MRALSFVVALMAGSALAQPVVTFANPGTGGRVAGCLTIQVNVASAKQVLSAKATIGNLMCDLQKGSGAAWACTLNTSMLPQGDTVVQATATDADNATGTAQVTVAVEQLPKLKITKPDFATVLRGPQLHIEAECQPHGPTPCSVTADLWKWSPGQFAVGTELRWKGGQTLVADHCLPTGLNPATLASGSGAFQIVAYSDRVRSDTTPNSNSVKRPFFVELSSPRLVPVQEVNGLVLDVDATRVLHLDADLKFWISPRGGGAPTLITARRDPQPPFGEECFPQQQRDDAFDGRLTADGALVRHGTGITEYYRTGNATPVVSCTTGDGFSVKGDFALFCGKLLRLSTAVLTALPSDAAVFDYDATGTVIYRAEGPVQLYGLYKWNAGVVTTLYKCSTCTVMDARLDGDRIIYVDFDGKFFEITPAGTRLVSAGFAFYKPSQFASPPTFLDTIAAAGGWTTHAENTGVIQLFETAPDGGTTQITKWSTNSHLEALSPTGEILYFTEGAPTRRRHYRPDGSDEEISSRSPGAYWTGAGFEHVIGNTVFTIGPDAGAAPACVLPPDAGSPMDAGSGIDAGSSPEDAGAIAEPPDAGNPKPAGPKPPMTGCGCFSVTGPALVALLLYARRRRRA